MAFRERILHGATATEHIVQLFDTVDSLANVVSAFLNDGWLRGDQLLVVARPANWTKACERLARRGCPVAQAIGDGRLTVLDAATTLARFTRRGSVDRQMFADHVGGLVGRLVAESRGSVRIYGEMVELLAEEGDLRGAAQLEELWNDLSERQSFTLLCGYTAAHFADPATKAALHAICGAHSRVQTNMSDMLGNWLVGGEPGQPGV